MGDGAAGSSAAASSCGTARTTASASTPSPSHETEAVGARLDPVDPRPRADVDAGALERSAPPVSPCSCCSGTPRSRCRPRRPSSSSPVWKTFAAERQRGLGRGQVQGREHDQVPERLDRGRRLAVLAQPGRRTSRRSSAGSSRSSFASAVARRARSAMRVAARQEGEARQRREQVQRRRQARHGAIQPMRPPGASTGIDSRSCSRSAASTPRRSRKPPVRRCSSAGRRAGRCRARGRPGSTENVAPPSRGRASSSVTSAPASAHSSAAVMPASPPPTTATVHGAAAARLLTATQRLLPGRAARAGSLQHERRGAGRSGRAAAGRCRPSRATQAALRRSSSGSSRSP